MAGFASVVEHEGVLLRSADVNGFTVGELRFPAGYVQAAVRARAALPGRRHRRSPREVLRRRLAAPRRGGADHAGRRDARCPLRSGRRPDRDRQGSRPGERPALRPAPPPARPRAAGPAPLIGASRLGRGRAARRRGNRARAPRGNGAGVGSSPSVHRGSRMRRSCCAPGAANACASARLPVSSASQRYRSRVPSASATACRSASTAAVPGSSGQPRRSLAATGRSPRSR